MKKFDDLDISVLKYHNIPYIIEAYKIFYGEYPTFDDTELEYKKFQLMISILTEYNIEKITQLEINPKYFEYSEFRKIPLSNQLKQKFDILESKIGDIFNLENQLEELCKEKPLSESAKNDIRLISYIIKQEVEKRDIEDPIEFLTQVSNVLCFRKYAILICADSYEEMVAELERDFTYFKIEYGQNDVKETVDFINSRLRLGVRPRFGECSTEEIIMFNDISNEILYDESYCGLLSKENNKKLIR